MSNKALNNHSIRRLIIQYEWLIILILIPVTFFPSPGRFATLLVIPILWLLRKLEYGQFVVPTPIDIPILTILFMVLVSLYATYDIAFSLPGIAALVLGVGIYYASVAGVCRGKSGLLTGILILLALGLMIVVLAFFGARWPAKYDLLSSITRQFPGLDLFPNQPEFSGGLHPNRLAGMLVWIFPVSLAFVLTHIKELHYWNGLDGRWRRLLALFVGITVSLLSLITIVLLQSRSAYLGLAVASMILVLGILGRRFRIWMLIGLGIILLIALAIVLSNQAAPESELARLINNAVSSARGFLPFDEIEPRLEIWSRAIYGIEDFPFTGMGVGTFREVVHNLYPMFNISPSTDIVHAHNIYLQIALDLGIPGLIAFLATWTGALALLFQTWRSSQEWPLRIITSAFAAALIGYLVFSLTEMVRVETWQGFWLLLGLIVGLFVSERSGNERVLCE